MRHVLAIVRSPDLRARVSAILSKNGFVAEVLSEEQDALLALSAQNAEYGCIVLEDDGHDTRMFIFKIRGTHNKIGIVVLTPCDPKTAEAALKGLDVYSVIGVDQVDQLDGKVEKACSITKLSDTGFFNIKRSLAEATRLAKETQAKLSL
jgi:hypothetical protein